MQKIYYFLGNQFLKYCIFLARVPGFWRTLGLGRLVFVDFVLD